MMLGLVMAACKPLLSHADDLETSKHWTTPNEFLARGNLTFIFGTAGLDETDAFIRTEARFIRDTIFPDAKLLPDSAIDVGKGLKGWPSNPVVYGGSHVNRIMTALRSELPFTIGAGEIKIGELDFKGDEYGLITVVPATSSHPEFLLYAGTGTPGVGGINSVWHGSEPILVTDRFGRYASGTYKGDDEDASPFFPEQQPIRFAWDQTRETVDAAKGQFVPVFIHYTDDMPVSRLRDDISTSVQQGASMALKRLDISLADEVHFYLYTDTRTKATVTNNEGDGHSTIMANAVHLLMIDPRMKGPMEDLSAHEATHVYAYQRWGPPGSSLIGEGLAVWVVGKYARHTLAEYASSMPPPPPAQALLGKGFMSLPERQSYPLAGLFVKAAIETVGMDKFMRYLYPATASTWERECKRAGTTPQAIQDAFAAQFGQ